MLINNQQRHLSYNFEICLRLIIMDKGKILLCRDLKNQHFFFPGGHLEFGEKIFNALKREMREELGIVLQKIDFIGAMDNVYLRKNIKHHEINLVFNARVNKVHAKSQESHISFKLITLQALVKTNVLPISLKLAVVKWLKDKQIFWSGKLN